MSSEYPNLMRDSGFICTGEDSKLRSLQREGKGRGLWSWRNLPRIGGKCQISGGATTTVGSVKTIWTVESFTSREKQEEHTKEDGYEPSDLDPNTHQPLDLTGVARGLKPSRTGG
jgi:hypothetical protein